MTVFIQYLVNGLSMGSVYAIIALGYTMVYGIAKMLNFAHGDVIMVGAYVSFCATSYLGLPGWASVILSCVVCTVLGVLIEGLAYKPLRQAGPLAVLITAIGVSYFLQNAAQLLWGATPKNFTSLVTFQVPEFLAKFNVSAVSLVTIVACLVIMAGLMFFTGKTKMGKAMRAVSEDKAAAQLMGINVNRTISMTFAIGSALAAIAGVLLCSYSPVLQPTTGAMPGIKAFDAAVFGGIGSINYGPLAAPGNVLSVKVMTVEPVPRVLTVPAPEALLLHHAYGTNGIILEVELALAPAHQWIERLDVFDDFADALNYANACVRSPGLVKRQVALLATPIADYFSHLNDRYRAGQHAVISLIAEESEGLCASLLPRHRGSNAIRQASDEARTRNGSLMEYCWNHTTLHALKVDNTLTYLQTAFDPLRYPQQILQMEQHFAGEVMSHIEFLRDIEGNLTASGLQLVRYTTPERLNAIMQIFRDNDVKINNPHVLQVEDGKQGIIRPDVVAVKQSLDPAGLLNPGKLRGWALRDQLELDSNPLARATRESPTT